MSSDSEGNSGPSTSEEERNVDQLVVRPTERPNRRDGEGQGRRRGGSRGDRSRSPVYEISYTRPDRLVIPEYYITEELEFPNRTEGGELRDQTVESYKIEDFAKQWKTEFEWTSPEKWMKELPRKEVWFIKKTDPKVWQTFSIKFYKEENNGRRHKPGCDYISHLRDTVLAVRSLLQDLHIVYYNTTVENTVPSTLNFFCNSVCDTCIIDRNTPLRAQTWRTTEDSGSTSEDTMISAARAVGVDVMDRTQIRTHRRRLRRSGHYIKDRTRMSFLGVKVQRRIPYYAGSDSSSSDASYSSKASEEQHVRQKALYIPPELEMYISTQGSRISYIRGDEVGSVEICILCADDPNPLLLKEGNISYIDYTMIPNADPFTLGLGQGWENAKCGRILTNELAREKILGRGEIIYTKLPFIAVKLRTQTTVVFDDYGMYQSVKLENVKLGNPDTSVFIQTSGSMFLRVLAIEQIINNMTGIRLGLVVCNGSESFVFRLTSYYGMISRLRNFSNLIHAKRKQIF